VIPLIIKGITKLKVFTNWLTQNANAVKLVKNSNSMRRMG
jgi:hypothetical protein